MNEISAEQSEAIIEAAACGQALEDGRHVGSLLAALHAPGKADGTAPVLDVRSGFAGRVARRSAVAASAAVLGLAGVAAAATGTVAPFDDGPAPSVVEAEIDDAATDTGDERVVAAEESSAAAESATELDEPDDADERGGADRPEIDGVDPSDGLDDEELALACDGAENHGHYVSLVARDKLTEVEGNHGERIRDAATSECGKPEAVDEEAVVDGQEGDPDVDEEVDDVDDRDDADGHPGQGNAHGHDKAKGNGHGNGNGNGNGRGHDRD